MGLMRSTRQTAAKTKLRLISVASRFHPRHINLKRGHPPGCPSPEPLQAPALCFHWTLPRPKAVSAAETGAVTETESAAAVVSGNKAGTRTGTAAGAVGAGRTDLGEAIGIAIWAEGVAASQETETGKEDAGLVAAPIASAAQRLGRESARQMEGDLMRKPWEKVEPQLPQTPSRLKRWSVNSEQRKSGGCSGWR